MYILKLAFILHQNLLESFPMLFFFCFKQFKKFTKIEELPHNFVRNNVALQGTVRKIEERGKLYVDHHPIFQLPFTKSKYFPIIIIIMQRKCGWTEKRYIRILLSFKDSVLHKISVNTKTKYENNDHVIIKYEGE